MPKDPSGIYSSTDRTKRDTKIIEQLSKARTDFQVLKQTPYHVGPPPPQSDFDKTIKPTNNNNNDANMSGEESNECGEEYVPFSPHKFCMPL